MNQFWNSRSEDSKADRSTDARAAVIQLHDHAASAASARIMSTLIVTHIVTGLAGIASGVIAVPGICCQKRMAWPNAVFLVTTAAACATGFVFLPSDGVTSAQLVSFFVTFLLAIAVYARYVRRLQGTWNQVYAFTAVGALFLNVLITTTQSFLHIRALKALAPTQDSAVFVAVKITLLLVFVLIALITAQRAGRS